MSDSCDLTMDEVKGHLKSINDILTKDDFLNPCIDKLKEQNLEIVFEKGKPLKIVGEEPIPDTPGIYMFWADFSSWKTGSAKSLQKLLIKFRVAWHEADNWNICEEGKKGGKFPLAYKTRIEKLFDPKYNNEPVGIEAIPFYLGRSEELKTRIEEHCIFSGSESTSALKLNFRSHFLTDIKFKVAWLPLGVDPKTYFIVDKIESLFRKKLNPIIGKQ